MKAQVRSLVANLYNPHEQSKEQLVASFVVRQDVFQELFREIKAAAMSEPEAHYVIEGPRGTGKTTLLLRLSYEVENDPALRAWLIPVVLKEEAYYGIRRLYRLWETIAQELAAKEKTFAGLPEQMRMAYDAPPAAAFTDTAEERSCFNLLHAALATHGKKILLCIDNLGDLLLNFSEPENLRLIEILRTYPHLRLIGATPVILEAFLPKNHVFARFFETLRLEGLNKEETRQLLTALAQVYHEEDAIRTVLAQHPGRVEALRLLTGGVIRTMVLLFEIFTENEAGSALTDLDQILDRVTPLYQSRMQDLTPLQREVVHAIALDWDAVSPAEIARKTRLAPAEVAAVLDELEKVFIVRQTAPEPSGRFYQLKERFFNIWYLMRLAPGGNRSKVLWLLHFLESWYNQAELSQRARQHTAALLAGRYRAAEAYYLTEAFAQTGQLDSDTEHAMLRETKKLLQDLDVNLAAELSPSDQDIFADAEAAYREGGYEHAVRRFLAIKQQNDQINFRIGGCFHKLSQFQEAEAYFLKASNQNHVEAMLHLGLLYHQQFKDYQNAETYYRLAAEKGNTEALLALGNLQHYALKNYPQAETAYLQVVKEGQTHAKVLTSGTFSLKALKNYLVTALKGEGQAPQRYRFNDFRGAKAQYLAGLKKATAEAALNLGLLYHYTLPDAPNALKYYTLALAEGETQDAAVNLALLYQNTLQDAANAEKWYVFAAEQGDASAMNGLAWLYFEQKRNKREALRYARRSVEQQRNMFTAHTLACIYLWNNQPADAVDIAQEFMPQEAAYQQIEQDILFYLRLLLAKKQHQALQAYFAAPELALRERFKPLYYAYLYCTDHPDFNKHPPELAELIDDLVRQTERLAADYA